MDKRWSEKLDNLILFLEGLKASLYSNLSLYLHPDSEKINSKHYLQRGSCTVYLYKDALMF